MSMQWKGYVNIGGTAFPCNSTGLEIAPTPLFGDDTVHNRGYVINYAQGQNRYEGTVDFPLHGGMWTTLKDFAITENSSGTGSRNTSKVVTISPDGTTVYNYGTSPEKCFAKSLTLRGNLNGVITGSLNLVATGRGTTGSVPTFTATWPSNQNSTPIPYWKSKFISTTDNYGADADATQVVSWEVTIENNTFTLYTFDTSQDPHDIQQGLQDVTGSITLYKDGGAAIPTDGDATAVLTITGAGTLTFTYLVYTGYGMNITGPNEKPFRVCPFRALGNVTTSAITAA